MTLAALLAPACASPAQPQLETSLDRASISPDGDGVEDAAILTYRLSAAARVSVSIQPEGQGPALALRPEEPRPAGEYRLTFDGSYPSTPNSPDRRVLHPGDYTLEVSAVGAQARRVSRVHRISISRSDTDPPSLAPAHVEPPTFSPGGDGVGDRATMSFLLSKPASVSIAIVDDQGRPVETLSLDQPREPGRHAVAWTGAAHGRPVPNGAYRFAVVARDAAGNTSSAALPVAVAGRGVPQARIVRAEFTPQRLLLGGYLTVRLTVKNLGPGILRTQDPPPGFVYTSYETFGSMEGGRFIGDPGAWRVGVGWMDASSGTWPSAPPSASANGPEYPYRWGLGRDLQPDDEAEVTGEIRFIHRVTQLWAFAGLIHEGGRVQVDRAGRTLVQVAF
jgi:hypothetical protein